jgi:ubiquinone/menaquinone biosynthesis C-methylase UbiE
MPSRSYPSRTVYDSIYEAISTAPLIEQISREVFTDEHVPGLGSFSFVTLTDLRMLATALKAGPGDRILDVGCGRGGPALWMCQQTGGTVTGVDYSAVGTAHARRRAAALRTGKAAFITCDATALGLADNSHTAAMSIEALYIVPDQLGALRELARILSPGAPLAFTTWEPRPGARSSGPAFVIEDCEALLSQAGFTMQARHSCAESERLELAWYARVLELREKIAADLGTAVAGILIEDATYAPASRAGTRKVLITARRGTPSHV